jgi:hypothetical protein
LQGGKRIFKLFRFINCTRNYRTFQRLFMPHEKNIYKCLSALTHRVRSSTLWVVNWDETSPESKRSSVIKERQYLNQHINISKDSW